MGGSEAAGAVPVLVVDDQEVFRQVLRELVEATPGLTFAGEASSGDDAVAAAGELTPGLVIMDKRMPGTDGVEATRQLTARHPGIVVILVSIEQPDDELMASSGATAFLRKQQLSPRALLDVLARSRAG